MEEPNLLEGFRIGFRDFPEGFYEHEGDLIYIVKEKDKLVAKSPTKWGKLGKTIYTTSKGIRDFDFRLLEPVNPYPFLQQKIDLLFDFIKKYKKNN